jgi:hypothetical protein
MQGNLITRLSLIASIMLAISACLSQEAAETQPQATTALRSKAEATLLPEATSMHTQPVIQHLILNHDAELSGNIGSGGEIYHLEVAGDRTNNVTSQAFLTFVLSDLPPGAIVTQAAMDLSDHIVNGYPFRDLGCLQAYVDRFGEVDSIDYKVQPTGDFFFQWCDQESLAERQFAEALMGLLPPDDDPTTFQIRLQFERTSDEDGRVDAIEVYNALILIDYWIH